MIKQLYCNADILATYSNLVYSHDIAHSDVLKTLQKVIILDVVIHVIRFCW